MGEDCEACAAMAIAWAIPNGTATTAGFMLKPHTCAPPKLVGQKVRIGNIGNQSLGVYVPKAIREALRLEAGMALEFVVTDGNGGFFRIHRSPSA